MSVTPGNPSLAQVVSRRKADLQESFLLSFHSADSGWRGRRGHWEFITEEQVPLGRPEQRGCGRAICFQSRSQKNPPLPEEVEFCLFPQSLRCPVGDSQAHSTHMAGRTSYSADIAHL